MAEMEGVTVVNKPGIPGELVALRVAKELKDGMHVNLGIGLPTLVSSFVPKDLDVFLHSENGILGYAEIVRDDDKADVDLVNAGGQPVNLRPGACFFDFATSFGMIRGRHLDLAILGAYEVSEAGDLANWSRGEEAAAIGGAMDLAYGARDLWVMMEHTTGSGRPRLVKQCSLPLTARSVVKRVFTNLAVITVTPQGLLLEEVAPGVTPAQVQALTEPRLLISGRIKEIAL